MSTSFWLAVAAAAHAGFQAVVTVVVYPALTEVPAERWPVAHQRHSRRISVVVGPVYLGVLAAGAAAMLHQPHGWTLVAVAAEAGALITTATAAAPLHGRLGRTAPGPGPLRRLLLIDRVRCAWALLGLAAALLAR